MSGEAPALRVSDEERDAVAVVLREHCVAGRLTLEEFSERTDRALEARAKEELDALTRDLPEPAASPEPRIGSRTSVMLIGGLERRGRWRLPERLRMIGLIGGAELDLSDAVIEAQTTTIEVWWAIGGLEVTVPEGIQVDIEGVTVIGGAENESSASRPGAPRVIVRHNALIGGTEVTVRRH
jgi:DUF1707 SHOCT-like domain/Cell wall-active antibiotics response LiaF, C-terminal